MEGASESEEQRLLRQIEEWARGQVEIVALYLFGSHATGTTHPGSDLDVAALALFDLPRERLWRLEDRWSADWSRLNGPRVDLSVLNLASVPFRFEVITRGRLLWARDREAVAEFESLTRRRYWDLRPLLERDWAGFVRRLAEARNESERREYEAALEQVRAVHRRVREAADDRAGGVQS